MILARSSTSTLRSRSGCRWCSRLALQVAGRTAITARPSGWRRSSSCSAVTSVLIDSAHWGLALVPVLVLLAIFVWLDAFELMSLREILLLLLLGGLAAVAAWPISGRMLD